MKYILIYLILLSIPPFLMADVRVLTFEDVEHLDRTSWKPQTVQIRGFLYTSQQLNTMILAAQPDLKSCCVGTESKIEKQIIIKGIEPFSTLQALTLEGVLTLNPSYNDVGKVTHLFVLEKSRLVDSHSNHLNWILIVFLLVLGVFLLQFIHQINQRLLADFNKSFLWAIKIGNKQDDRRKS